MLAAHLEPGKESFGRIGVDSSHSYSKPAAGNRRPAHAHSGLPPPWTST